MPVKIENSSEILTQNDQELALQACDGCRLSFDELVNRYSEKILKFIFTRTRNLESAEDIVQDAFIRAWQNIEKYDPKYSFSTWLYTIAIRLTQNHFRKKRPVTIEDEILDCRSESSENPVEQLIRDEQKERLWSCASKLKPDQYNILWLKYVEQKSVEEISRATGKSQVSIKVALHRARAKLAEML